MENISSLRQLEIFTLSMTQAHSMGKGGDYLKKFMPAHRPYRNVSFSRVPIEALRWVAPNNCCSTSFAMKPCSMLTPETIFHCPTSNIKLV